MIPTATPGTPYSSAPSATSSCSSFSSIVISALPSLRCSFLDAWVGPGTVVEVLGDAALELVEDGGVRGRFALLEGQVLLGQEPQARLLADRPAVVAVEAPTVPVEQDHAQAPVRPERCRIRDLDLGLPHGVDARCRHELRPVGCTALVQME